jgi:predicted RNA-binding protein YlqC (UPF0109 family)
MIETQFIEYIVKQLVDNPDAVKISRKDDERGTLLELIVAPDDLGRVIGKHGATAQSLRSLLRALGTKNNEHYNLKIVDTDAENTTENSRNSDEKTEEVENSNTESVSETVENSDDGVSERAKKLREDLADLDDLDI